jgi:L-amino acid N-acyltransferase YncA
MIRAARGEDAASICVIYNWYVANTTITFEEQPVTEAEMQRRIASANEHRPWFVLEEAGRIQGYAYASEWKPRTAYRYTVETTVYLDQQRQKNGMGTLLYQHLIAALEKTPVQALIAGIALPNAASIALHEKVGFKKVGHFSRVGWKFAQWVDVGYWQLRLDSKCG